MSGLTLVGRQVPVETGFVDLVGIDEDGRLVVFELKREKLTRAAGAQVLDYCAYLETLPDSEIGTLLAERSGKDGIERIGDFEEWYGSQRGESLGPSGWSSSVSGSMRAPTEWCPNWRTGPSNIRLVTFHGQVHGQEMLLARQVRAADDTRTSSAGPPGASDLKRKATERGVYPAAVDLCQEEFEQLRDAIPFEGGKCPDAPGTRRAPDRWYGGECRGRGRRWQLRLR